MTQEKINIAELLKDCHHGMELDCTIFENVCFDGIVDNENLPIRCRVKHPDGGYHFFNFTKHGSWLDMAFAKCVLFPKGKTTWDGFVPPCRFKDGDVISDALATCIFKREGMIKGTVDYYCGIHDDYFCVKDNKRNQDGHYGDIVDYRLATKEEKQKLFDAIKENGYKWNPETKTLEKLIEQKFDITTLKPFNKVLVRDTNRQVWTADLFSHIMSNTNPNLRTTFVCVGHYPDQCIPFEGNEHLLGKTDDCDEFYKTWE